MNKKLLPSFELKAAHLTAQIILRRGQNTGIGAESIKSFLESDGYEVYNNGRDMYDFLMDKNFIGYKPEQAGRGIYLTSKGARFAKTPFIVIFLTEYKDFMLMLLGAILAAVFSKIIQ
ncbi:MAG: hypothetical protein JNM93_00130 [Bacteriovoracaceae bacterium]|nr:hypothetical protein [Bacteriovoracaceae bacterium]